MSILTAIGNELIQRAEFLYRPTRGKPFTLTFCDDGTCRGSEVLKKWVVAFAGVGNCVATVIIKDESGHLQSSLSLERSGVFKGRERGSSGAAIMEALEPDVASLQLLARPKDWYNQQEIQTISRLPSTDETDKFLYGSPPPPAIEWKPYEYDLAEMVSKDGLVQSDTAIALIAADRAAYFERVVQSIGANPEAHKMPVFLFLDKVEGREEAMEKQAELARKFLPHVITIRRPRNYGCGRNIIDARVQLFTNMKYEQVFVFEDDLVISPHYIKVCLNLMKWADQEYTNVGAVQAWNKCFWANDTKSTRTAEVALTYTNWWGYLLKKTAWDAMSERVLKYQKLFLGGLYHQRPHRDIIKFFDLIMTGSPGVVGDKRWVSEPEIAEKRKAYFDAPPTGQDAITMHCLESSGFVRLTTSVNRGEYIGRNGIHMNPRMFERDGLAMVEHEIYDEDATLTKFVSGARKPRTITNESGKLTMVSNV